MKERTVSCCEHKPVLNSCKKCGIYMHSGDPAMKTKFYESLLNCSATKYLQHMRRRQCKLVQIKQINQSTSMLLESICEKFQYSSETLALGMYIFAKTCQKEGEDQKFWAASSLIVASKGIELDKRVPYLNRYQRYADKTFSQEDYQLAEKTVFQEMGFDIQYSTFLSFLSFYMTVGFVFQSDTLAKDSLTEIQDELLVRAKRMLRTGTFLSYEPQLLALSLIKEIRVRFGLEPWKKQLQQISGYMEAEIQDIQRGDILKPQRNPLNPWNKQTYNPSVQKSTVITSLQNTHQFECKPVYGRKRIENTFRHPGSKQNSIKQNSFKLFQQPSLNTINRNHSLTVSKYPGAYPSSCTTDRALPSTTFTSQR